MLMSFSFVLHRKCVLMVWTGGYFMSVVNRKVKYLILRRGLFHSFSSPHMSRHSIHIACYLQAIKNVSVSTPSMYVCIDLFNKHNSDRCPHIQHESCDLTTTNTPVASLKMILIDLIDWNMNLKCCLRCLFSSHVNVQIMLNKHTLCYCIYTVLYVKQFFLLPCLLYSKHWFKH